MLLKLEHIYKDYVQDKLTVPVLKDICFQVERGEYVAIMGPSGSGKTTLMNIIGCLDVASSGVYQLNGTDLKDFDDRTMAQIRNRSIGFVFQTFNLLPKQTALDNVALPLLYSNVSKKERMGRAKAALERVGLGDRLDFRPTQLSGGQKQRVAIAGILAMHPSIIILDEATSMLDPRGKIEINNLVHELNQTQNMTILSITHDIEEAALSDHVILLDNGHIIDEGTPEKVLTQKEELERIGLDVPFAYKISKKLHDSGYPIKPIINKEKLVKELCQLNLKK